jgi:predicted DNA-binding transcriptional regulator YafY
MLLLLSYIVEKQGTHGFWPDDPKYHRVTFREIERDFGIPAGEVPERINELTSYISAGSDLVFNMLQVDLTDHDLFIGFIVDPFPGSLSYQRLTEREAVALKTALKLWGRLASGRAAQEADRLAGEVDKLLDKESGESAREMSERVLVAPESFQLFQLVETLERAIADRKVVTFTYHDPAWDDVAERKIDPYSVLMVRDRWYLLGFCHEWGDERTFYLDEVSNLEVLDQPFLSGRLDVSPDALIANPLEGAEAPIKVRLRFRPPAARWVEERSSRENIRHFKDGSVVSTIHVRSVEGLKKTLLQFGDAVEVLEPKELRKGLLENARRLLEVYEKRQ